MGQFQSFYRFILLPSFVGLACYACTSAPNRETTPNKDVEPLSGSVAPNLISDDRAGSRSSALVQASSSTSASVSASSTAYRDGINLASSAHSLSQTAISPDDWSLIASRWQQASDQLKQIEAQDKNYAIAQQKVNEYARNANQATAQLVALQQSMNAPMPVRRPPVTTTSLPTAINESNPSNTIKVPVVRRLHGTPVVEVLFNGERRYEMILDTGASRTLITRQMADELGIVATERMVAATASDSEVTFELGQMRSMSVGDIMLQNARVSIGDSINVGLLGNDFLQGYDVTIRAEAVELAPAE